MFDCARIIHEGNDQVADRWMPCITGFCRYAEVCKTDPGGKDIVIDSVLSHLGLFLLRINIDSGIKRAEDQKKENEKIYRPERFLLPGNNH